MRAARVLLVTLLLGHSLSTAHPLLIDTGHQGVVSALAASADQSVLASGGEEGSLKIWDVRSDRLVASLAVSRHSITALALHPERPLVAALTGEATGGFRLTVWDWDDGEELYSLDLSQAPTDMGFSTRGNYLYYTRAQWQSLQIFDASTGRAVSYMNRGFGLVSFVAFSRSERNLMTYQPSGRIIFWELRTGRKIKEVSAPPDLEHHSITEDFRYLIAASPEGVMVVDVATGLTVDVESQTGLLDLRASDDGSRIVGLARDVSGEIAIAQWIFRIERLTRLDTSRRVGALRRGLASVAVTDSDYYVGGEDGLLLQSGFYGSPRTLSANKLANVHAVAAIGTRLALATDRDLMIFDLEHGPSGRGIERFVRDYTLWTTELDGIEQPGLAFVDEETLALWDRSAGGTLHLLRSGGWRRTLATDHPEVPLQGLWPVEQSGGQLVLTLDQRGTVRLVERSSWETRYRYPSPAVKTVRPISPNILVAARTAISTFDSSLIRIDTQTGETVPLTNDRAIVYALASVPLQDRFFSLSVLEPAGETTTVLRLHEGANLERVRTLLRHPGEDADAIMVADPRGERLYTTLGGADVRVWESGRVSTLESTARRPAQLALSDRLLVSLNTDGTVTGWDVRTGERVAVLYLFRDSSWVALFPSDQAFVNNGADAHLIREGQRSSRRR